MLFGTVVALGGAYAIQSGMVEDYVNDIIDSRVEKRVEQLEEENQKNLIDHAKGILENRVLLESEIRQGAVPESPVADVEERSGNGYIVRGDDDDYIITVAHNTIETSDPASGGINIKTISRTEWEGVELELIARDREKDYAVFRFPNEKPGGFEMPEYEIELGRSSDLDIFDRLYLIGNPGLGGTNIREAIVSNELKERELSDGEYSEGFNISSSSFGGDSGNAVMDERGKVVALAKQSHYNGVSTYVTPIDWFKEYIE